MNNGVSGYFRMFLIGALSHYLWYNRATSGVGNLLAGSNYLKSTIHVFKEFVLDFETGETFLFTYRNFKDYLKTHDAELLKELEASKNKRDMIHHFLLKYNEKHPIYFPAN